MEDKPVRSVIGVYAADEGESTKAFGALRAAHLGDVRLFCAPETTEPRRRKDGDRYAALCLESECLLVAKAAPAKVPAIVRRLQSVGSPAVFVLPEELTDLAVPEEIDTASVSSEPVADFARKCAERRGKPGPTKPRILARLRNNELTLEASRRDLAEAARLEHALTASAEWLLDNGHLIRTQVAEIRRHLPRRHHEILPAGASGDPYVYELARELVAHTDNSLTETKIQDCLRAYQQVAPLTIAELWSFPLLLRTALIEELAHLALHVSHKQQLREAAYFWANRLAAAARRSPEVFEGMLHQMEAEPVALQAVLHDLPRRAASGRRGCARAHPTLDRGPPPDAPHRNGADRAHPRGGGKRLDREFVQQPPCLGAHRLCRDFRVRQPDGCGASRRPERNLRPQRFCHSRSLPPGGRTHFAAQRSRRTGRRPARRGAGPSRQRRPHAARRLLSAGRRRGSAGSRDPRAGPGRQAHHPRLAPARDRRVFGLDRRADPQLHSARVGPGLGCRRSRAGDARGAGNSGFIPAQRTGAADGQCAGHFSASSRAAAQDGFPRRHIRRSTPRLSSCR